MIHKGPADPLKKTIFEDKILSTVPRTNNDIETFTDLIRSQFSEKVRNAINSGTNFKLLKEWSSLQTMLVVNEIDKEYGVLLDMDDLWAADSVGSLFEIVQSKQN